VDENEKDNLQLMTLIFQLINDNFGNLKTWEDWVDLYMVLFKNRFKGKKIILTSVNEEPEFHPHSFNDLVHKTTLYFQAAHTVRLPFAEAQKRVTASVCALLDWEPTHVVKYHQYSPNTNNSIIDAEDVFRTNSNLKETPDKFNFKIQNTGQQASVMFVRFRHENGNTLTNKILECSREQSKRWAKANNKNQTRDWHQIVSELCNDSPLTKLVIPPFIDLTITDESKRNSQDTFQTWTREVRKYVLTYLHDKEGDVEIFRNANSTAVTEFKKRNPWWGGKVETTEEFVDFCMYIQVDKSLKKKKKTGKKTKKGKAKAAEEHEMKKELGQDGSCSLVRPPFPVMPTLISTMFSYLASGSRTSIEAISKVASLNGSRVPTPRYNSDVIFMEPEAGFKEAVRVECSIFDSRRKYDIWLRIV
jgi:hypothetical protein